MIALRDESETMAFGARLSTLARIGDAIGLSGALGAGKTTLARGFLQALGLEGEAPSPSFAIVQPYEPPETRMPVAHIDLYRIEDPTEVGELALGDLREDSILLVEWPERLGEPMCDMLLLTLMQAEDGTRRLTATVPAAWEGRWPTLQNPLA